LVDKEVVMTTRALISLLLVGAAEISEACAPSVLAQRAEAVDTLVRVDGHALHFVVHRGRIPVTLLLEAGGGADLTSWGDVPRRIASTTGATVVAYDRAGLGGSSLPLHELTPAQEIRNLRSALNDLAVPNRAVLVATSYGAMLALLHAAVLPADVVGLVLVDPMNPGFARATGDFLVSTAPQIRSPSTNRERVIARQIQTFPALVEEVAALEPKLSQPMVVITAGKPWWGREDVDAAWRSSHEALAAARVQRRLVVAEGSDHNVPQRRPDVITAAVEQLLKDLVRPDR
jgi:pimeloyl-ACP methyl ester carboxylesterase